LPYEGKRRDLDPSPVRFPSCTTGPGVTQGVFGTKGGYLFVLCDRVSEQAAVGVKNRRFAGQTR